MKKFTIKNLTKRQKDNRRRILEISYKRSLSHIGSCLNSIDIIDAVYKVKKKKDLFILSNGHAGVAWYVILERNKLLKEKDLGKLNIHPDRNIKHGIHVSTGSLGHGLPIALGMALADRGSDIYCLLSDGECAEGSVWESLRLMQQLAIKNIKVMITVNGWGAYDPIDASRLRKRIEGFGLSVMTVDGHSETQLKNAFSKEYKKPVIFFSITNSDQFTFLNGQDAHYHVMSESDYISAINALS